jgi:hypothetical protein
MLRTSPLVTALAILFPLSAAAQDASAAGAEPDRSDVPRTVRDAARGPQGAFPPPPPRGPPRTINAAVSLGPGWLALRDALGRDGQAALSLGFRLGVVVGPQWNLVLGIDRSSTDRGEANFSQTAALFGLQRFFLDRLYFGLALGIALVQETGVPDGITDGPGGTISGHLGIEALRTRHTAITLELGLTLAQYVLEKWEMGGLRVGIVRF